MNKIKKITLFILLTVSTLYCTQSFGVPPKANEKTYQAVAKWFMSINWYDKLRLKVAVKKCKEIEWSKVYKEVQKMLK